MFMQYMTNSKQYITIHSHKYRISFKHRISSPHAHYIFRVEEKKKCANMSSDDPLGSLGFRRNPDGSVSRAIEMAKTPASADPNAAAPVLSKDVPLNPSTNTSLRLFLPRTTLDPATTGPTLLPLIIYAHGGGFIILSAASAVCHHFCSTLALSTPAVVASVEYRLAPEHRLPAAYEDCMQALSWARTTTDDWIVNYADRSCCYLMGTSAGGNIALHVALHADDLIKGLILHQPFFGGVERTASEMRLADNKILPIQATDLMWEMALPAGADRDHEYCNPMRRKGLDVIKEKGWKVAATSCGGDPLVDRQKEVEKALEGKGVAVVSKYVDGEYHGYDLLEPSKAELIMSAVKETIQLSTTN
ncbi:carboxylesterase 1-like [Salvia miltiorrhiza]|uniref:carboxylesterase 1-like n=1 Tax=Salvia miltiorrhiza TaxID=226208 RepID=UPI0025AC8C9E|nr:carboxylesterase 1-like [Salvia miltiorrhiza]